MRQKENQLNNYVEQQRQEMNINFEKEIQNYKEILLKQEREMNNFQLNYRQQNEKQHDKLEEKIAMLTTEIERLMLLLNEKNSINLKLEEKCAMFTQEIERLQLIVQRNVTSQKQAQESSTHEIRQFEEKIYILEEEKITIISDTHKISEENRRLQEINLKLEERIAGFSTEIDRLNLMLQSRQSQYEERIANMTVEIERLTTMLQTKQNQYEERITNLTVEIERLTTLLQSRTSTFEEKIVQLTTEIQHLIEVKNYTNAENTNSINEMKNKYEEKIAMFTQEIQRLSEVIRQRDEHIADEEEKVKRSKHTYKDILEQERATFELIQGKQKHHIIELENEIQFAKLEIQRLQERVNDAQMERDKAQSAELSLNREIENLQDQNCSKIREIEGLHERIRILEKESEQRINDMKNHFEMMKQSHISREVQELTIKFNSERKQFETQVSNLIQSNKEHENNLQIITAETDRLRQICDRKAEDIENLKQTELLQQNKIENLLIQIQKLTNDVQDSQQQCVIIQEELHRQFERQKQLELEQLEREMRRDFTEQLGQLNQKLNDTEIRNQNILVSFVLTVTELERIKDQNEKLWEDNCILQQREKQIEIEFQEEFTQYKVEIEQSNRLKLESELKEIYDKIETQQKQYNEEITTYQVELKVAHEAIQNLKNNIIELENKLVLVTTENNRLQLLNQEKERKIQQYEIEINNLKEKIIQIENKFHLTQMDNSRFEKQIQNYDALLRERDEIITLNQACIERYLIQIVLTTSSLESLSEDCEEFKKQNKKLIEEVIPNYEKLLNQTRNDTTVFIQEKTEYYERVIQDNTIQFEKILVELENRQISSLAQYVITCTELERQVQTNEELKQYLEEMQGNQEQLLNNIKQMEENLKQMKNTHQSEKQEFTLTVNENELSQLQEKYKNFEEIHSNLYNEYQLLYENNNQLIQNLNALNDEKKQLESELSDQYDKVKCSKKQNDDKFNLHQQEIDTLTKQKNQLESEKEEIQKERDELINCINDLEGQYRNLNEDYRNLEQQLQEQNQHIQNILLQKQQSEDEYNQEKKEILTALEQHQDLIRQLNQQIGNLDQQNHKLEDFVSELEYLNKEFQGQITELQMMNKNLQEQYNYLYDQNRSLSCEIKDLQEQIKIYYQQLQEKEEEITRSKKQSNSLQEEFEKTKQQQKKLNQENEIRYQQQIQTIETKFEETIIQFNEDRSQFEKEIEGYENIIRMLETNIETLTSEKQTLVEQAQERMKQLEEWRQKYAGVGGEDTEKLLDENEEQRKKIHELEDKLFQKSEINGNLQVTINKYEQEIKLLDQEKCELIQMLESRKQENDKKSKEAQEMRDKIIQLNEQIRQLEADLIKKSDTQTQDTMKQSQTSCRQGSEIKAKYHQMFQRAPLEQKDSNRSNIKNRSVDLSQYSKLTTVVTTTQIQTSQFVNKENVGSQELEENEVI